MVTTRAVGLIAVTVVACAGNQPGMGADAVASERVTITVDNRNLEDVRVFVQEGGISYSVGRIAALRRQTFELPGILRRSSVRFRVQPIRGASVFTTREVYLANVGHLEFWVANHLRQSQLVTR